MVKKCLICKKEFKVYPYSIKLGFGKYCSSKCYGIDLMGKDAPNKGKKFPQWTGKNAWHWKGGKTFNNGYVFIYQPKHPFAIGKYVAEHRLVMEKHIKRYIKTTESVHHIDKNKINNHYKNLIAFTSESAHQRFHKNPFNVKSKEIIFNGSK